MTLLSIYRWFILGCFVCLSSGLTFELTMKGPLGAPAGVTGEGCTHTHHSHTHVHVRFEAINLVNEE